MKRPLLILLCLVPVVLVALCGVGGMLFLRERPISSATSPDGTWSIAVVGLPRLNGAYEIAIRTTDQAGKPAPVNGSYVAGIKGSLDSAKLDFVVRFVDNETASLGTGKTINKQDHFPLPP